MDLIQHISNVIEYISFFIGIIGVLVILAGAVKGAYEYVFKDEKTIQAVRLTLGSHLILGLDFMVGKDVIDTMLLLNHGENFWKELAALVIVVAIRIILTLTMEKELETLQKSAK